MNHRPLELVMPWIEEQLGRLPDLSMEWPDVAISERRSADSNPFLLFRTGMAVSGAVCEEWLQPVNEIARSLHPDLLFSPVGCYDLSRVTLKVPAKNGHSGGTGIWGPVPAYVADAEMWRPVEDDRPVQLNTGQLTEIDWNTFWHCASEDVLAAFGIYEDERLAALATVIDHGAGLMEVGVDVAPGAKGRKLGSAVVSAAGNWILDNGGVIYATAAAWNVPSTRNLRRLGMEYACSMLEGLPAPFRQPPQPLGSPVPGVEMMDQYPRWAMNRDILPKREL